MIENLLFILLILAAGLGGYYLKSLSRTGASAAVLVGLAVYLGFGGNGIFLLGAFFATSSLFSKYKAAMKVQMEEKLAKGSTRDWRQVFANGGIAAVCSILYSFSHHPIWLLGFAISIASANSDTWASEIGSLSSKQPMYIRTLKPVERGTSGAISLLGSLAALSGSLLIAALSWILFPVEFPAAALIFLFGYIGNVIDTVLGAFIQQNYQCVVCGLKTEKKEHCEQPTVKVKGVPLIDNDTVNFLSGLLAVLLALGIKELLHF